MNITVVQSPLSSLASDLMAIGVRESGLTSALSRLSPEMAGPVAALAAEEEFTGKAGTTVAFPGLGLVAAGRVLLVGLGAGSNDELRRAAGAAKTDVPWPSLATAP